MSTMETDYRIKWVLHEGDTIQTADATYTITGGPIGLGGSSVLYPASKTGSDLEYALKECFPAKPAVYQRINGIIKTANPDDELNQAQQVKYRTMLSNERKLGQKIRNATTRAVSVWDGLTPIAITTGGKTFTDVSEGIFSVLERMDKKGRFFNELLNDIRNVCLPEEFQKTFGLPSIHMTARIMEQALLALQQVHKAGYYYGDLNGSNVFFSECEPKEERIGIGHLIDFGSTRKLEPDGFTTPIIDDSAYSSDGFRPFEIRDHKGRALRLSKQADIYSMGCLMLRCVHTPAKIKTYGDSPTVGSNALNEKNGKAIGCTGRTLQLVNEILDKATRHDPKERYADATEMLDAILELKKCTEPPKFLLPSNLSTPECFDIVLESRRKEMQRIANTITHKKPVFIWGFPGLGKTELSIAFARTYNPDKSYLVRYSESMRNTIINLHFTDMEDFDLHNLSREERAIAEEKIYKMKLDVLKKYPSNATLIIDNFDSKTQTFQEMIQEPAYIDLLGTNMQILITTRSQPDDVTPEIQPLQEQYLLKLMRRFIGSTVVKDDILLQLLEACGYHTLSVELIGKAIGNKLKPVSPEYILQKLQGNQLKRAVLPKARTSKDRVFYEDTIYGHLKTLFDIAYLSEIEKTIMCHAALLPTRGIDTSVFLRAECSEENQQAVEQLVSKGWLHVSRDHVISLHPLVCDLVNEELGITHEKCKFFLHWMWNDSVNDLLYRKSTAACRDWSEPSDSPLDFRKCLVEQFGYMEYTNPEEEFKDCRRLSHLIAEVFASASFSIPDWGIPYASEAAYCFDMAGDRGMCLQYSHFALDGLIKKATEKSNKDWRSDKAWNERKAFTTDEALAASRILEMWCPRFSEGLWDVEYADLYGNELFMDHSSKPIQVQNIYAKLRYLFVKEQ